MTPVDAALGWLGTPYHPGARIKGVGVDCAQLLIAAYEECGFLVQGEADPGPYSHEWHLHRSEEVYLTNLLRFCDPVKYEPMPGDIVMFKFGRCVSHAGIITNYPYLIHAYVGMGVIISRIDDVILCDKHGKSRLAGAYRPNGRKRD